MLRTLWLNVKNTGQMLRTLGSNLESTEVGGNDAQRGLRTPRSMARVRR